MGRRPSALVGSATGATRKVRSGPILKFDFRYDRSAGAGTQTIADLGEVDVDAVSRAGNFIWKRPGVSSNDGCMEPNWHQARAGFFKP
jgi:hypothetical protein